MRRCGCWSPKPQGACTSCPSPTACLQLQKFACCPSINPQTFLLEELKERAIELLPLRTQEQRAALLRGRRKEEEAAG